VRARRLALALLGVALAREGAARPPPEVPPAAAPPVPDAVSVALPGGGRAWWVPGAFAPTVVLRRDGGVMDAGDADAAYFAVRVWAARAPPPPLGGWSLRRSLGPARALWTAHGPPGGAGADWSAWDPELTGPRLARRAVRAERRRWESGWSEREQSALALVEAAVAAALSPASHPLARPSAPPPREALRVRATRATARRLAARPLEAVIFGPEPDDSLKAALGRWVGPAAPPATAPAPAQVRPGLVLVDLPGLLAARVRVVFPAPAADAPAAERVAAEVLAAAANADLPGSVPAVVREGAGLVYAIEVGLRQWPGHGRWEIDTVVAEEDVPAALAALRTALDGMGAPPDATAQARCGAGRARVAREWRADAASADGWARRWARDPWTAGPSVADAARALAFADVDAEDLAARARADFGAAPFVVVVGDAAAVDAALAGTPWRVDRILSPATLFAPAAP